MSYTAYRCVGASEDTQRKRYGNDFTVFRRNNDFVFIVAVAFTIQLTSNAGATITLYQPTTATTRYRLKNSHRLQLRVPPYGQIESVNIRPVTHTRTTVAVIETVRYEKPHDTSAGAYARVRQSLGKFISAVLIGSGRSVEKYA